MVKLFSSLFIGIGTVVSISCFVVSLLLGIACMYSITEFSLQAFIVLAALSYLIGLAGNCVLAIIDMFFDTIRKK